MARTGPEIPHPTIKVLRPVALSTGRSLLQAEDSPQQVRKHPVEERERIAAYGTDPRVVERGEAPFAALASGDEGLNRIACAGRRMLPSDHGPSVAASGLWPKHRVITTPHAKRRSNILRRPGSPEPSVTA